MCKVNFWIQKSVLVSEGGKRTGVDVNPRCQDRRTGRIMPRKAKGSGQRKRAAQFEWSLDLEKSFIEAYEDYHCLWDTEDDAYFDRDKRNASHVKMGERFDMSGQCF